jgi:hypothetical protein
LTRRLEAKAIVAKANNDRLEGFRRWREDDREACLNSFEPWLRFFAGRLYDRGGNWFTMSPWRRLNCAMGDAEGAALLQAADESLSADERANAAELATRVGAMRAAVINDAFADERDRQREYRALNRDYFLAYDREYRAENHETIAAQKAAYDAKNREKRAAAARAHYAKNREEILAHKRAQRGA